MFGSCIAVALLAILFEGLKVLREYVDVRSRGGKFCVGGDQDNSDNGSRSASTSDSAAVAAAGSKQYGTKHAHKPCVLSVVNQSVAYYAYVPIGRRH